MNDPFRKLAEDTHFNIYMSNLWTGTARRFAEAVVEECARCCGSQADMRNIRRRFGLPVEGNVKYAGPETQGHHSQYDREYNIPKEQKDDQSPRTTTVLDSQKGS
jgi:hypothetical protein